MSDKSVVSFDLCGGNGQGRIGGRNGGRPISPDGEVEDVSVTDEWDHERMLNVPYIGNSAHDDRTNCSANDGHDKQGRAQLGIRPKILKAEGEDGGEHNRMKKSDQDDGPCRDRSSRE